MVRSVRWFAPLALGRAPAHRFFGGFAATKSVLPRSLLQKRRSHALGHKHRDQVGWRRVSPRMSEFNCSLRSRSGVLLPTDSSDPSRQRKACCREASSRNGGRTPSDTSTGIKLGGDGFLQGCRNLCSLRSRSGVPCPPILRTLRGNEKRVAAKPPPETAVARPRTQAPGRATLDWLTIVLSRGRATRRLWRRLRNNTLFVGPKVPKRRWGGARLSASGASHQTGSGPERERSEQSDTVLFMTWPIADNAADLLDSAPKRWFISAHTGAAGRWRLGARKGRSPASVGFFVGGENTIAASGIPRQWS